MINQFSRTEMLIGEAGMEKLKSSTVAVFGIGGVGSYTVEALARAGVGKIVLVDNDDISITNINRQIHSNHKTIGRKKTEVMKERIIKINPNIVVECYETFVLYDNVSDIIKEYLDYVVDAVDTVTAKLAIIEECNRLNIPVISSMGTGNKLHPEMFELADIYKTSVCPLAKVMRHELKKRGIPKLLVCYSKEVPLTPKETEENTSKRATPGSISFVPSVSGLIIAGAVVRGLLD